jgi:hypothetical protein
MISLATQVESDRVAFISPFAADCLTKSCKSDVQTTGGDGTPAAPGGKNASLTDPALLEAHPRPMA